MLLAGLVMMVAGDHDYDCAAIGGEGERWMDASDTRYSTSGLCCACAAVLVNIISYFILSGQ